MCNMSFFLQVITVRKRSCGQVMILLPVCQSFCSKGVPAPVHYGIHTHRADIPQHMATAADGTHHTRMHSYLSCYLWFRILWNTWPEFIISFYWQIWHPDQPLLQVIVWGIKPWRCHTERNSTVNSDVCTSNDWADYFEIKASIDSHWSVLNLVKLICEVVQ